MRSRTKFVVVTVASVLLIGAAGAIAGPPLYRDYFAPPPVDPPTLMAQESALRPAAENRLSDRSEELAAGRGEQPDVGANDGDWVVGSGSTAAYRLIGETDDDRPLAGRTDEVTGSLTLNEFTIEAAQFSVDVGALSREGDDDTFILKGAARVDEHSVATFRMREPVRISGLPSLGDVVECNMSGDLTFAGVTRATEFTMHLSSTETGFEVAGALPLALNDFGVTFADTPPFETGEAGFVEFELVLQRP